MAHKVIMPKSGMAMETGKIIRWLKNEGDRVEAGEPLLEIETDKVSMEIEAVDSGVLLKILAHEGDDVPVTRAIAYIGEPGEELPEEAVKEETSKEIKAAAASATNIGALKTSDERVPATPAAKRIAKEKGISLKDITPGGSRGQIKASDVAAARAAVKATPLAKAVAESSGLELSAVSGSGFAGKILKEDVLAAKAAGESAQDTLIAHSAMRKVIAKRMFQSHAEIPAVTQNCVADVTELMALRNRFKTADTRPSINDFIILAVAKTLKEQPRFNASYTEEGMLIKKHINIGIAVALPEGLIVPVINDADKLTLRQISEKSKELAEKAREGRLAPGEYSGGTFTISNLGMFGVTSFTPIINQPEVAILGVCAIEQKLEMDAGQIVRRMKMGLSLTYDHRCIDGAQAAIFSNRIAEFLENPLLMID